MFLTAVTDGKIFAAEQKIYDLKKENIQVKVIGKKTFKQQKTETTQNNSKSTSK